MSFLENPSFPACPSFGHISTPNYSVTISQTAGGHENRNRNWSRPLHVYSVTVGPRLDDEVQELLEFWHAMGGTECGFRYKDYADFKSSRTNQTISALDQPLVEILDSPGGFQLVKAYRFGTRQQIRPILKPVFGVLLADDGAVKTETVDYVVDYTTGVVSLNFSPVGELTAGFHFDVPVRFDSDFPIEILSRKDSSTTLQHVSFMLKELRLPEIED